MRVRLLAGAAVLAVAGCVPSPAPAGWELVVLPAGVHATALAVAGEEVLVGGQSAEGPAPRLLRVRDGAVGGEFRLEPADPNAAAADLFAVTVAGDDVHALGSMIAGAHSNPRLTVWDGSLAEARLTSRTQEFFTFGGHDAGPLLGTAVVDGEPVIFGSRVGATGPYGLLWTRHEHTWTPQRARPELRSSPDREFGFGALAALGGRLLVAGDELGLAGGLTQQPVVFVGTASGGWRQRPLPVPADLSRAPGQLSRATSIACPGTGDTCWVSGWVRGHALAWPVTLTADGDAAAGDPAVLPGDPPAGNGPVALVALAGDRPVVLTNAPSPSLQVGCPAGWRGMAAPPGASRALVAAAGGLYAVADGAVWRLPTPSC